MANNFYKQGSHGSDTLTGLMSFWGFGAAGHIATIRQANGATTGYQVTAGKTLYITRVVLSSTSNAIQVSIGYGDTDIGMDSAADPTNYVKVLGNNHIGATTANQSPLTGVLSTSPYPMVDVPVIITIPASKFPTAFFNTVAGGAYLEGFEV